MAWLTPDLPLASASSDMIRWSRVLLSHALDAARSYRVLVVQGAGITEWPLVRGRSLLRTSFCQTLLACLVDTGSKPPPPPRGRVKDRLKMCVSNFRPRSSLVSCNERCWPSFAPSSPTPCMAMTRLCVSGPLGVALGRGPCRPAKGQDGGWRGPWGALDFQLQRQRQGGGDCRAPWPEPPTQKGLYGAGPLGIPVKPAAPKETQRRGQRSCARDAFE